MQPIVHSTQQTQLDHTLGGHPVCHVVLHCVVAGVSSGKCDSTRRAMREASDSPQPQPADSPLAQLQLE